MWGKGLQERNPQNKQKPKKEGGGGGSLILFWGEQSSLLPLNSPRSFYPPWERGRDERNVGERRGGGGGGVGVGGRGGGGGGGGGT